MKKLLWLAMILIVGLSGASVAQAQTIHRKVNPELKYLNDTLKGTRFEIRTSAASRIRYLRKTSLTSIPHSGATSQTVLKAMAMAAYRAEKDAWKDIRHIGASDYPMISTIALQSISSSPSAPLNVLVDVKRPIRSASIAKAYAGWCTDFSTNFGRLLFDNERRMLGFRVNPPGFNRISAVYATCAIEFPQNVSFLDSIIMSKSEAPPYFVTLTNEYDGIPSSSPFMYTGQGPSWNAAKMALEKIIGEKWR